jgi:hypothetical protein
MVPPVTPHSVLEAALCIPHLLPKSEISNLKSIPSVAASVRSSSNAFVAEVARYLAVDPEDVTRMIRVAKLPALRIPKETRTVQRIPLRDFHAWLLKRTANPTPELASYETFLADFDASRIIRKNAASR